MVSNAYKGRFILLRIKVIIYNRSLAFCFPSKPRLLAQAPLRNNTRLLMLLELSALIFPTGIGDVYLSIYLPTYLFWKNETSVVPEK